MTGSLVWMRSDLRAGDNPALSAAVERGEPVTAVFLDAEAQWREHDWGDAKIDFVRRSVSELHDRLAAIGVELEVLRAPRFSDAPEILTRMVRRLGYGRLLFNREYEVNERRRDAHVHETLGAEGVEVADFDDQFLLHPHALRTSAGHTYRVFTPFWRALGGGDLGGEIAGPLPAPVPLSGRARTVRQTLPSAPRPESAGKWSQRWPAGEGAAQSRLEAFLDSHAGAYDRQRDVMDSALTSELSPYLAVGSISPRQCWHAAKDRLAAGNADSARRAGIEAWLRQLGWREFYRNILVAFPRVGMHRAFQPRAERVHWRDDAAGFEAWCAGQTGVPIVDAAMRQLRQEAWMPNRARMIAASFLCKNLLIDWRAGERHFCRELVDADLANNNGGWQWVASTGTDAAPYFRVFNPWTQARKFDPKGAYIRRHVPELGSLPGTAIHRDETRAADQRSATGYPRPIVDCGATRRRAIAAYAALR